MARCLYDLAAMRFDGITVLMMQRTRVYIAILLFESLQNSSDVALLVHAFVYSLFSESTNSIQRCKTQRCGKFNESIDRCDTVLSLSKEYWINSSF